MPDPALFAQLLYKVEPRHTDSGPALHQQIHSATSTVEHTTHMPWLHVADSAVPIVTMSVADGL